MSEQILLAHGSGGRLYHQLVQEVFVPIFGDAELARLQDAAVCDFPSGRLAFTTDSFVVNPLFFPGGDIGRLAVCGTVNDLAMSGAQPLYLSVGMIIEAGFTLKDLTSIARSMARAAQQAGVRIVTGDTKVVEAGRGDGIYINTAGVGVVTLGLSAQAPTVGDVILVNGRLAEHGLAVLAARQGLSLTPPPSSDVAPLNELVKAILDAGITVKLLRDPTRGGLAATCNEWAEGQPWGIELQEQALPLAPATDAACELLGLDPLYVANEGKLAAIIPAAQAPKALAIMQDHPLGKHAACIGTITDRFPGRVSLTTAFGGNRVIDMPEGEQLPRIC